MNNNEIRETAKALGVRHWQIAEAIGMREDKFAKLLRRELRSEQREGILEVIHSISEKGKGK